MKKKKMGIHCTATVHLVHVYLLETSFFKNSEFQKNKLFFDVW